MNRQTRRRLAGLLGVCSLLGVPVQAEVPVTVEAHHFGCIREMTPVRHFYLTNLLGNLPASLAAANAPEGAIYPPGTLIQLVPGEAMVKREAGFSPATGDWEFFELEVSAQGTQIRARGFAEVNNRFGGNCFACHAPARQPWDFVCEDNHGCESIPVTRQMIGALQRSDPRCGEAELQDGDRWALFKLQTLVWLGEARASLARWW